MRYRKLREEASLRPPRSARLQWLLRYLGRRLHQLNPRGRSRRNAAHRYDVDSRLYGCFLDADRHKRGCTGSKAGTARR
jgi:hypothetical protein